MRKLLLAGLLLGVGSALVFSIAGCGGSGSDGSGPARWDESNWDESSWN